MQKNRRNNQRWGLCLWFGAVLAHAAASDSFPIFFQSPTLEKEKSIWVGPYIGAHGGWGWSSFTSSITPFGTQAINAISNQTLSRSTNGALFGGQLGYLWRVNQAVLGAEVDLSGTGINGAQQAEGLNLRPLLTPQFGLPLGSTTSATVYEKTPYLLGVRGRLGTTWHDALLYVTAGGAWRQIERTTTIAADISTPSSWMQAAQGTFTHTHGGYVVGAGGEWRIAPQFSLRGEYLYYGFNGNMVDNVSFASVGTSTLPGNGISVYTPYQGVNVVRLGVNYYL